MRNGESEGLRGEVCLLKRAEPAMQRMQSLDCQPCIPMQLRLQTCMHTSTHIHTYTDRPSPSAVFSAPPGTRAEPRCAVGLGDRRRQHRRSLTAIKICVEKNGMQLLARHDLHPENAKLGLPRGNDIPAAHGRVQTQTQILPRMRRRNNTIVLARVR